MSGVWVDLAKEVPGGSSVDCTDRCTPVPFGSDSDYMRMLREAQNETSARTSARVSPITSAFVSQASTRAPPTPKSPPPSPNLELCDPDDIYINRCSSVSCDDLSSFVCEWATSPLASKNWRLSLPRKKTGGKENWSKRTLASLLMSNLLSLLLGAGIGVWIYRRSTRTIDVIL